MQPQKSSHLILILLCFYQKLEVQKLIQAVFELFQIALGNCLTYQPGPHQDMKQSSYTKSADSDTFTPANDLCLCIRQAQMEPEQITKTCPSILQGVNHSSLSPLFSTSVLISPVPGISNFFHADVTCTFNTRIPFLLQSSLTYLEHT